MERVLLLFAFLGRLRCESVDLQYLGQGSLKRRVINSVHHYESVCLCLWFCRWTAMDGSEPLASIRETLFYRICLLAHEQGLDLQTYVPPLEKILNVQEMKESGLAEDKHFLYLVKLMYEDLDLRIAIEDEPDITIEDEPDS
eukprot:m.35399 g.35399  ORF g.35399 m.35399 type:complete len:142 (+) comp32115_c0_seq1:49-474(+)